MYRKTPILVRCVPTCRKVWLSSAPWPPVAKAGKEAAHNILLRMGKYDDPTFLCLWTKVREISRRCRRPVVVSNTFCRLFISRSFPKIFVIKSQSRGKYEQMLNFLPPPIFWEELPPIFVRILSVRFAVFRLGKFGWVPFADLRERRLAMK